MRLNGPFPSDLSEPGFRVLLDCANSAQKMLKIIKDFVILFMDEFSLKFYKELFTCFIYKFNSSLKSLRISVTLLT
tara:strand:+ start:186 stop:413 length:228 start_codon:yes stop_codon:yes gene_type:complete